MFDKKKKPFCYIITSSPKSASQDAFPAPRGGQLTPAPLRERFGWEAKGKPCWGVDAGRILPSQALILPSSGTPRPSAPGAGCPPAAPRASPGPARSTPGVPSPPGMKPPAHGLGAGGRGRFNPRRWGPAGQGGCSDADTRSRERFADPAPLYQNLPFSPHSCLFPFQGVWPPPGLQTCRLRDAAALPTPKQSRGHPKTGGSLPALPGASLLWKRDSAKGLWHWEIPPRPRSEQGTRGFAPVAS